MSLLKKIQDSDIPPSTYEGNELDDEGLDYLAKIYEENKSLGFDTWEIPVTPRRPEGAHFDISAETRIINRTGGLALICWRYHVGKPGFIHLGRGIGCSISQRTA